MNVNSLQLKAAKRMLAVKTARDDLLAFSRLMAPDPQDVDDPDKSLYEVTPLARLLCQIVQDVVTKGCVTSNGKDYKFIAVSVGPQLGKSEVLSRNGLAWAIGKKPRMNIILGSYNQPFANEFGDAVRNRIQSPTFAQVFPETKLRKGQVDLLITEKNGRAAFVGRGGSGTGKPADLFLVDDPLKDEIEASSETTRAELWNWFTKVALTRCHDKSAIIVVHTRWNEDDLIGRLCDPEHPERDKKFAGIAEDWLYINIPAVVTDPKLAKAMSLTLERPTDPKIIKAFGNKPMSSIWPGRKSLPFLAQSHRIDASGFNALYMGRPAPEEGDYFKIDWMVEYDADELPENLEKFAASDHAVSVKQKNDPSVLGGVGVDEHDTIWVLPDLVWERMPTDKTVDEMIRWMKEHTPSYWTMEGELISKSFGPFLIKRMHEEKIYVPLDEAPVTHDKRVRARSIQGRMAMKKVRFPRFAWWWPAAKQQLLKFDNGTNDDFVDFMAHVGNCLLKHHRPNVQEEKDEKVIEVGSAAWVLARSKFEEREKDRLKAVKGW